MGMRHFIFLAAAVSCTSGFLDSLHFFGTMCKGKEFTCGSLQCIPEEKRCDNVTDCRDKSDEEGCDEFLCKSPKYFRCKNSRCIDSSYVCNGDNDCEDFSDEAICGIKKQNITANSCGKGEWQCTDKMCIPIDWVCNDEIDCEDGSDESIGCSVNLECDGFKCRNGHCIIKEWRCDGNDDCRDNSDEMDCETQINPKDCTWDSQHFLCSDNKTCIHLSEVCDGKSQCPDKSDESSLCSVPNMSCNNHDCSHECVQLPTGPRCICPKGYHNLDEKHCQDINECLTYGICDHKCRNTHGSYECYCAKNYTLQDDKRTCKVNFGEPMMFFSTKNEIRTYMLTSELYVPVAKNLKQVVGVAFDGEHVYWTDIFSEHESIVRSLKNGEERELLVTSGLGAPEDLDVDWVTGNVYFTDAEMQHIGVCTNDGTHCTVLVNKDVHKPRGIALNPTDGEMFWTDWGKNPEIARSLMDGSNDMSFVSTEIHWPNGLTIDFPNRRMYWTDAKLMTLESINLDGTDRRIILEGVVKHPYAIAVFENRLYWSDWSTHSIQFCDKFTGKNHHTLIKEKRDFIYGINIYHPTLRLQPRNNPCESAFCSDICLLQGKSYTCACPQDKELSFDGHTCKDIGKKQMLILGARDMLIHLEHQLLGKHDVSALPFLVKNVGCLAYNSVNNTLYVSDLGTRRIISLDLHSGTAKPLPINNLGEVVAMDFDHLGNNLYLGDKEKSTIEVVSLNTMSRKILLHDLHGEIPESLVLVPEEGVMFVAFQVDQKRESHVDRLFMDGSGRTHSIEHGLLGPISLVYDATLHRVFFSDAGTGNIESTSVEGHDRHGFRSLQTAPIGLASLKSDIFWVNENSRRVYWADKLNSDKSLNKKITLDIPSDIEKMHIISVTPKKMGASTCQIQNGGCSHLCLHSQKNVVCACPIGMYLEINNRTCTKRLECEPNEFLCGVSNTCIHKEMRCDGKKNCEHGEDEEGCRTATQCPVGYFQCQDGECIKDIFRCDFEYSCKDKSDEHNCSHEEASHCPPEHFKCNNGNCIGERFVCDGVKDCLENEDEANCVSSTCEVTQFRCLSGSCIPKSWECDHEYDCLDLSDEHSLCRHCPSYFFSCANGRCLDKDFVCDQEDDCGDGSDEISCEFVGEGSCTPEEFACSSNKTICLHNSAKCNGTAECPHHEDEQGCSECHVEEFSCKNKKCIPTQWLCDHADDCGDNSDEDSNLCLHSSDVPTNHLQVPCAGGFSCKNGHCIDLFLVCNNEENCYDGSDEGGVCKTACDTHSNPCSQECVKTPSGPMCTCKSGFKLSGDGHNCEDINECRQDPPVCSQICINNLGANMCDCYDGFLLRSDKVSCKASGTPMSLVFTQDNQIRELSQMENTLKLLFTEDTPKITGLDVDANTDFVYFSIMESGTLHRINRRTKVREFIGRVGQPQKMSIDWITKNVYFTNAETRSKSISICNFEDKICAKLIDIDIHRQVSSIAVDSVNGVMFYSLISWWMFNSPSFVIYKTNLDGSDAHEMVKSASGYITGLAFDFNKRELYYVDQHHGRLSKINYDGTLNTAIATNLTRPMGLSFFENHLYFLSSGGYMGKCQLYEPATCSHFKLHGYSNELFAVSQNSRQPMIKNPCANHTCNHLCVPNKSTYKCLCENGKIIPYTQQCQQKVGNSNESPTYVSSFETRPAKTEGSHPGAIIAAIMIPIALMCLGYSIYYLIKKKNSGSFNVRMRFYNPLYGHTPEEPEKNILEPGQHEYTNPVEFLADSEYHRRSPVLVVNV